VTEGDFKRIFKKSVFQQGGFAMSLNAGTYASTPDLYVALPGFAPFLLEAKFLKDVGASFRRKIDYSALQRDTLQRVHDINALTGLGLVGFKYGRSLVACLCPIRHTHVDETFPITFSYDILTKDNPHFDVKKMFTRLFELGNP
jgi:hypothetical protein